MEFGEQGPHERIDAVRAERDQCGARTAALRGDREMR
jgi:hypothetical protein